MDGKKTELEYDKVFRALGDKHRIFIMDLLMEREMNAGELLEKVSVVQSTLSHHMKALCESGLVTARKEGKWTYYAVSGRMVALAKEFLDRYLKDSQEKAEKVKLPEVNAEPGRTEFPEEDAELQKIKLPETRAELKKPELAENSAEPEKAKKSSGKKKTEGKKKVSGKRGDKKEDKKEGNKAEHRENKKQQKNGKKEDKKNRGRKDNKKNKKAAGENAG